MHTLAEQYTRQINEKKIKERIIISKGVKLEELGKNTEVKYLPKEFNMPSIATIYSDKIAFAIFEKPYYVILIKSKTLAKTYKSIFEVLWKTAKK